MGLHHFLQLDFVWFLSSTHVDSNGVSSVAPTSSCWKWQEPTWGMFVMCLLLNYHWTTVSFLCIQYLNLFLVDSFKRRIWLYFNHEIIALQWYPSGEEYEHIAGWWFQTFFIFHFIYGIIILPIDFHILKDGYCTTNQSLFFSIFVRFFSWPFAKPWGEAALYGLPSMLNHSAFVAGRGWWFPWTAPRKGGSRETWNLFGLRIGIPMICCKW